MDYFEYLGIKIYLGDFQIKHWLLHENEFWKDIPGYEGLYQASTLGRVKSLPRKTSRGIKKERIRKMYLAKTGYLMVGLTFFIKCKTHTAHRLIALTFIPNPENKPEVNHKKGIKYNIRKSNLEWATNQENITHAIKTGLTKQNGEDANWSKLKNEQVLEIRRRCSNGENFTSIANEYQVAPSCISAIHLRRNWKHI